MKPQKLLVAAALAVATPIPTPAEAQAQHIERVAEKVITRASFDIGSGDAKIVVADVNSQTQKITKIWHSSLITVGLRRHLKDGHLPKEVGDKLILAIKELQKRALPFKPTESSAVGTSVFRTAKNGQELLERVKRETGLRILLLPHEKEAEIGFLTAVGASGKPEEDIISWDSGSGSFQITALVDGKMEIYKEEFAYIPALKLLCDIRKTPTTTESPNPVSKREAHKLIRAIKKALPKAPNWLKKSRKEIIGIGSDSIFTIAKKTIGHSPYTKEEVKEALEKLTGKSDKELSSYKFEKPDEAIVSLALLYAMMDHCNLDKVTQYHTTGCCEGLLTSKEYWLNRSIITRAALDMGSGSSKIVVADVNPLTQKITKIWHKSKIPVLLELDPDHCLSQEMGNNLVGAIKQMQQEVRCFEPKEWAAAATSIFRTAKNGQDLLKRVSEETGLNITLVPQNEEGELGLNTAAAMSQSPKESIMSIDVGSRSFQMATYLDGVTEMFGEEFGRSTALELFFENHRTEAYSKQSSPNPIQYDEVLQFIDAVQKKLPPPPRWTSQNEKETYIIDEDNSSRTKAIGHFPFTKDELLKTIMELSGKTDEELLPYQFSNPKRIVVALALLYAIMDHCHIDKVHRAESTGNCEGLLITPRFWS